MVKTITNALTKIVVGLFQGVFGVFKAIFNGIKSIIVAIYTAFYTTGKKVINSFKPVYKVTFTMYHVIPGVPVQENVSVHAFERGAHKEAMEFYNKVVSMTMANRIAPTEVKLIKGKKTIQSKQLGPIEEIKKFKFAA